MRIIKLYPEDHELFAKDVHPDDYAFYQNHIATFKRMWKEQGSTFWLRFLITFREHVKVFTFECQKLLNEKLDLPICAHVLSRCLDEAYVHIHKEFLEGDCGSAKSLLCDIFTLAKNRHLITELESPSLVYDPFYAKSTRDSFRKLFGNPPVNKKAPLLKVWIICPVYLKFGGATCSILRRWLAESDICDKQVPSANNQCQYWMPFGAWNDKNFKPDLFEEHMAKTWGDKLPSMLLTTNVNNTFLRGVPEKCSCMIEKNDRDMVDMIYDLLQIQPPQKIGTPCKKHDICLVKIIHSLVCSDPQFCTGHSPCVLSCESEIRKNAAAVSSKTPNNSYWKSFEVVIEPCDKENRRNVGTYCETHNTCVESYLVPEKALFAKNISDFVHGASDFPPNLPPEMLNALMQIKRVEGTRDRLRSKLLDKKQKLLSEKLLQDPDYRIKMYEKAITKFRNEMEAEAHLCGCNNWEDHAQDFCKHLQNGNPVRKGGKKNKKGDEKENAHMLYQSHLAAITSRVGNSVAVGTDERSGVGKILQARKRCSKKSKNPKQPDDKNTENGKSSAQDKSSACDENNLVSVRTPPSIQVNEGSNCDEKSTSESSIEDTTVQNEVAKDEASPPVKSEESTEPPAMQNHDLNSVKNYVSPMETSTVSKNMDTIPMENSTVSKNMDTIPMETSAVSKNMDTIPMETSAVSKNMDTIPMETSAVSKNMDTIPMETSAVSKNMDTIPMETSTVSKNMDTIEKAVEENGGLGYEEIMLMLKTTEMMMGKDKNSDTRKAENSHKNHKSEPVKKRVKLHFCAHCRVQETEPSTFKKCSRCKQEKFTEPRYYCSRACQVEDWEEMHRDEHQKFAATVQ